MAKKVVFVISAAEANANYFEVTPKIKESFVVWSHNTRYGSGVSRYTPELYPKQNGNYNHTSSSGSKKFQTFSAAIAFGKKQALYMGEGTDLQITSGRYTGFIEDNMKWYTVHKGKLIPA